MTIVFDLETIADMSVVPYLSPIKADVRLVNPQKIEENIQKKEAKRMEELALQPTSAMICCFGWHDGEKTSHIMLQSPDRKSEKKLLKDAWEVLSEYEQFITFNGFSFDVPVLLMRSTLCRVRPSVRISQKRYTNKNHCDVRMVLGQWDKFAKGNLDFYSSIILGKPGKSKYVGSEVAGLYEMELFNEIGTYCEDDCQITRELYEQITKYYLF